jgi:ATP-binding cassette subfamily B protein
MNYYLKKYWAVNTLAALLQITACGIQVLTSLAIMQAFQGIVELNMNRFLFWLCVDLGLYAVLCISASVQTYFQSQAIKKMNGCLRSDMATSLLRKNHQQFHAQESGEYLSQFTNDINQIEQMAWNPLFNLIGAVAQVVFSVAALTTLHWSLLVASLAVAVVMMVVPKLFQKRLAALGTACAQNQATAVSGLKDCLAGYDVLRFFGKDNRFMDGIAHSSDKMENAKCALTWKRSMIGNGLAYVSALCQVALNILIGILSIRGIIIQSALMGGGNLCSGVYNGLNQIASLRLSFAASKPYFDKITVHTDDISTATRLGLDPIQDAITLEHVGFQYNKKPVLQNASLRFEKGKKYALTGPSGCGKSTLLKLLLGWLPDYTGFIRFDGKDARAYTPEQIQQQMSYIEQNVFLFNTTIRENITLGEDFTDELLQRAIQESALSEDLANMPDGLDTIVGEEGSNLSGGQKQRVAIARALIHNRSILLVDEGTSALDQKNADIVEKSLLANPNLTLILVSHHLTTERKAQFDQVYDLKPVEAAIA